jgi:hypothetical protein
MATLVPLHAGDAPVDASHYGLPAFLQSFLDSETGVAAAIGLHTAGVLLFMVGLGFGAFKVWRTSLQHPFSPQDLRATRILTWSSLCSNLIGGSMRLAQSDHPTLASLNASAWVQIILAKHIIWVALVGITYVWLHRQLPGLVGGLADAAKLDAAKKGAFYGVALVLMVTVAGAAASAAGPGAHGEMEMQPAPAPEVHLVAINRTMQQSFNGTITGVPTRPASQEIPLQIPVNATRVAIQITWSDAAARLELQLVDPAGDSTQGTASDTQASVEINNPARGTWRSVVSTQQAIQTTYSGTVQIDYVEQVASAEETEHGH